jgi:hypothetical protein
MLNAKIVLAFVVVHTYIFVAPINLVIDLSRHDGTMSCTITILTNTLIQRIDRGLMLSENGSYLGLRVLIKSIFWTNNAH